MSATARSDPDGSRLRRSDPGPPQRRWNRLWFEQRVLPIALVAPAVIVILGVVLYPLARTLWLSVHEAGLASLVSGDMDFVGLDNYLELARNSHLRTVFVQTAVLGLSAVAGTMALGLAVALLLNQRFRGRGLLSVLVLLPWAVPAVAATIVWKWMFNDQYGIVNWALAGVGLDTFAGYPWFNARLPALFVVWLVVVWQSFPFVAISLLAGLQSIPEEIHEAAELDGAGPWKRLIHITLPMLKPLLLVLFVISTIWDFKIFDQVMVMTGGGPARRTEVIVVSVYREAFTRLNFGTGSALAVSLFVVLAVFTIFYIRVAREEDEQL